MLGIHMTINNCYGVLFISIYVFYFRELYACMFSVYIHMCVLFFVKTMYCFPYCSKDVILFKKKYILTYLTNNFFLPQSNVILGANSNTLELEKKRYS